MIPYITIVPIVTASVELKKCVIISLVPRLHSPAFLAPCRKAGREPGIFHHVLRDVGCVVWCVV